MTSQGGLRLLPSELSNPRENEEYIVGVSIIDGYIELVVVDEKGRVVKSGYAQLYGDSLAAILQALSYASKLMYTTHLNEIRNNKGD